MAKGEESEASAAQTKKPDSALSPPGACVVVDSDEPVAYSGPAWRRRVEYLEAYEQTTDSSRSLDAPGRLTRRRRLRGASAHAGRRTISPQMKQDFGTTLNEIIGDDGRAIGGVDGQEYDAAPELAEIDPREE